MSAVKPCKYGSDCYREDCLFGHPTAVVAPRPEGAEKKDPSTIACRYGADCTKKDAGCKFSHPAGVMGKGKGKQGKGKGKQGKGKGKGKGKAVDGGSGDGGSGDGSGSDTDHSSTEGEEYDKDELMDMLGADWWFHGCDQERARQLSDLTVPQVRLHQDFGKQVFCLTRTLETAACHRTRGIAHGPSLVAALQLPVDNLRNLSHIQFGQIQDNATFGPITVDNQEFECADPEQAWKELCFLNRLGSKEKLLNTITKAETQLGDEILSPLWFRNRSPAWVFGPMAASVALPNEQAFQAQVRSVERATPLERTLQWTREKSSAVRRHGSSHQTQLGLNLLRDDVADLETGSGLLLDAARAMQLFRVNRSNFVRFDDA